MVEVTRREREGTAGGFGLAVCTELGACPVERTELSLDKDKKWIECS